MRKLLPFLVLAALCACSGAGGGGRANSAMPAGGPSGLIPMSATPTPMPTILIEPGYINGLDNQFTPNDGDTASGGHGSAVDGIACAPSMVENKYHVHFFVGVMVNGRQMATPDAIGMLQSGTETNGYTNSAHCYYMIHTHDASGLIHVESASTASLGSSLVNLGEVLDVWGERLASTTFGPFSGTVRVFYAKTNLGNIIGGPYYQYTGTAPRSIPLYSHEAIWIQIGSSYVPASRLPRIRFYTQY